MTKEQFLELIRKVSDGEATDQEIGLYNKIYNLYQLDGELWDEREMGNQQYIGAKLAERINKGLLPVPVVPLWRNKKVIAVAAILLVTLSISIIFSLREPVSYLNKISKSGKDVNPGTNKAILTLSTGKKIMLTDSLSGELASENGLDISKTAEGTLVYKISENTRKLSPEQYNTIETPKGGQYHIILPDGTKIWLNASSVFRYPASFSNFRERRVELQGEAYFEVSKVRGLPFIVKTDKQEVEVLGTHFNVNAYPDEPDSRTTLLEGRVKVTSSQLKSAVIEPGQQALVAQGAITVKTVDTEQPVDWKNDEFIFKNETLGSIMRKIARWYDVEIVFIDAEIAKETFSGSLSRQNTISEILKTLELTDRAHFKIDDRKVLITK